MSGKVWLKAMAERVKEKMKDEEFQLSRVYTIWWKES